jgi:hypothetical protein
LAGIFNQYVNPVGLEALAWKFYFVYIVVLVIECLVIYFFYVETRGPVCISDHGSRANWANFFLQSLEEIAVLFDGPNANVGGAEVTYDRKASIVATKEV